MQLMTGPTVERSGFVSLTSEREVHWVAERQVSFRFLLIGFGYRRVMTEPSAGDEQVNLREIYLNDHWAGAAAGLALATRLAEENANSPLRADLAWIADQIRRDRETLAEVRHRLRCKGGVLKTAVALIGERLSRLKLNGRILRYSPLSRVLELEALISGVSAKQRLWVALRVFNAEAGRLADFDFERLEAAAGTQLDLLSSIHEVVVRDVFSVNHSARP
jgi:hypothetical protein